MKELPLSFEVGGDGHARTASLPPELSLLVLDNLASPGTFLLVHFIAQALKTHPKRPVVLVGLAEGESAWDGLLRKQVRPSRPL